MTVHVIGAIIYVYNIIYAYIYAYIINIYAYITNLVCYTYFHWFFNPECQHIFKYRVLFLIL
jgi:hypothetical protein